MNLPPPVSCGAPRKFKSWRPSQVDAICSAIDSPNRFIVQAMPTGAGKSLCYIMQAVLTGRSMVVLTSTKGLQSQLFGDFSEIGLVDVRGKSNYRCPEADVSCEDGPCYSGYICRDRDLICPYILAVEHATHSRLVVTNYAFWLYSGVSKLKPDLLIMDEAHMAPAELAASLRIEFAPWEYGGILRDNKPPLVIEDARVWADEAKIEVEAMKEDLERRFNKGKGDTSLARRVRDLKSLESKLTKLAEAEGPWVGGSDTRKFWYEPLWPAEYARGRLYNAHADKVVLVSATVRPKTADILGLKDYLFEEYPSRFPAASSPVYHVPTIRLNHRSTDSQLRVWVSRIDQIIGQRLDRKGIVHTVSYARRDLLMRLSDHTGIMLTNKRASDINKTVAKFRNARPPAVLVSPSISHGWDFPYTDCEYLIAGKIPFPDTRDPVLKARCKADTDYSSYLAAVALVQAAGRGMRAEDDQCETFILDDNVVWFYPQNRAHFPEWFRIRKSAVIPRPFKCLTGRQGVC